MLFLTGCESIYFSPQPVLDVSQDLVRKTPLTFGAKSYPIPYDKNGNLEETTNRLLPRKFSSSKEPLVLLAISGGGSRSAYYSACVLESLSKIKISPTESLADKIRVVSTVSGGGLAGAYFTINYAKRHEPGFYDRFRKAMAQNYVWSAYGGVVFFPPRAIQWISPWITRTDLLAQQLEQGMDAGPITFGDLADNEVKANAPYLVVNSTIYNSGQRLAFTNLPPEAFRSLFKSPITTRDVKDPDSSRQSSLLATITLEQLGLDIRKQRIGTALAASAAFPVAFAPIPLVPSPSTVPPRLQNGPAREVLESRVAYLADGGLHDNFGTDSLLGLIAGTDKSRPVMLIVIDASARMETMNLGPGKVWYPWSAMSRMYDIGSLRPIGFLGSVLQQVHDSRRLAACLIRLSDPDPERHSLLHRIPTWFSISVANRMKLDRAAKMNVDAVAPSLIREYNRIRR